MDGRFLSKDIIFNIENSSMMCPNCDNLMKLRILIQSGVFGLEVKMYFPDKCDRCNATFKTLSDITNIVKDRKNSEEVSDD